jgi:thiol-disulfide isomerase/thioredoxin
MSRGNLRAVVCIFFLLAGFAAAPPGTEADDAAPRNMSPVRLYFFWGNGCPHCEREKEFLSQLKAELPALMIESYEVWQNRANAGFFSQMTSRAGIRSTGVPVTFIGNKVVVGFSERDKAEILSAILACLKQPCMDPVERLSRPVQQEVQKSIDLPLVGSVDPSRVSLPMITILLGFLDSFNPCAFFVLFFLLSLLVHARSRTRMFLIGFTFIFFSGLIYFLFMAAWLNLFLLAGNLTVITVAAGVVALAVSVINVKDFFMLKKGVSLSIPESAKPGLYAKMRNLVRSTALAPMLAGTIVLAVAANTYELLCTAGFPMVFTRILTLHGLPAAAYYTYLALYNVVYIIPLAGIVTVFTVTLGARKLTEWEGRKLKLVSGLMMLCLGLVLILRPALLTNLVAATGMLVSALLLSWIIISLTRRREGNTI